MRTISLVFATGAILLLNACISKECQFPAAYEFEIPVSLSPTKETFNIGDTISVVSTFSDQVYERRTDKWYTLENFRFYPEMIIREISNEVTDEAAILQFDIIIDSTFNFHQFNYSDGGVSYIGEYSYSYDARNYSLEYKIVPKEAGLFVFSHPLLIGNMGKDQEFDGMCKKKLVDAIVNLNEGADNNIELLRESPNELYNETVFKNPERKFHENGAYAFVVVE